MASETKRPPLTGGIANFPGDADRNRKAEDERRAALARLTITDTKGDHHETTHRPPDQPHG